MGLLEKLKNTFFEEEYVEVEEKPKVKKEPRKEIKRVEEYQTSVEKPKIFRREEPIEVEEKAPKKVARVVEPDSVEGKREAVPKKEDVQEEKLLKRETSFGYFDDDDFLDITEDLYQKPANPVKKVTPVKEAAIPEKPKLYDNPAYGSNKSSSTSVSPYSKEEKKGFKPTPIISPIYGILDKNYTKEEIAEKREIKPSSSYVSRKNADLDSVREKAFGSLAGDFGLTVPGESIKEEKAAVETTEYEPEDNLLYDMTDSCKTPSVDKVTLQDAEEYFQDLGLEYNIDYKDAKLEHATGRRVSKTPKIDDIEVEEEPIQKENSKAKKQKVETDFEEEGSLEDNLFDLIDSMYDEKE